jgi:hypothetical protein
MASIRSPLGELTQIGTADDIDRSAGDGTDGTYDPLDLTGAAGALIFVLNDGNAGTVGVDILEFSTDGGSNFLPATAANLAASNKGHAGLLYEDGSAAASTNASLSPGGAGVEPAAVYVFSLGPVDGPFEIRVGSNSAGTANAIDWSTGCPSIWAMRIG